MFFSSIYEIPHLGFVSHNRSTSDGFGRMGLVTLSRSFPGANSLSSMSQEFHQGIFSFSDGFDRSAGQENQHHIAQQSRRDKLRVHGFDPTGHPLVPIDEEGDQHGIYEPSGGANMLSEMFNYATPGPNAAAATDLLANQISLAANYRFPNRPTSTVAGFSGDWYGANRKQDGHDGNHHMLQGLNVDSSAAMQLFLMPTQQHPRSPSPQPPAPTPSLHHDHHQAFHTGVPFNDGPFRQGHAVERQGLSLSLASSQLQPFEMAAKAEEMRVRDGVLYFNEQQQQQQQQTQQQLSSAMPLQHDHGQQQSQGQSQVQMGYGPMGVVNVLRNSKYARAAEELLEEFCSVGRGQLKSHRIGKHHASSSNPNPSGGGGGGGASSSAAGPSSSSKDLPPLSPAERFEYQRKKAKLLSMLDEVDRRYNHYCDQMQMVVNSFDSVMGFGAATPYTALAQRAMSRHFRCLKDAIAAQLKQTCELLGEDGGSSSGITKGETPRLRLLDQSLRQQRAFHQMGMTEQEAWRPQRGLPERSVTILRAWLFEHFLHPYPSDADKQLLARRTGLSRNQVSNWFINARVRLWKPMVEEMYQQESKEAAAAAAAAAASDERDQHQTTHSPTDQHHPHRPETNAPPESDPSQTHHRFATSNNSLPAPTVVAAGNNSPAILAGAPTAMRFGATGDVSLTLGLRHAGNAAENSRFTVRDFGGC